MKKIIFFLIILLVTFKALGQKVIDAKNFLGTGDNQVFKSVVDDQNNTYLIGYFNGTVDVNGTPYVADGTTLDAFVSKYDTNGNLIWFRQIGSNNHDYTSGLTLSKDGTLVYVVGYYFGSPCNFGDGITLTNSSSGTADAFLLSVNTSDGTVLNAKTITYGNSSQVPTDIGIDKNLNLVITGYVVGNNNVAYFDSNNSFTCIGPRNPFLLQLNPTLNVNWFKQYTSPDAGNTLYSVDIDNTSYYIAGINKGTLNFDIVTLSSLGNTQDMFLYKTDFNGNGQWIRKIKGSGNDVSVYSTCDQQGHIYISGYYASTDLKVDSTSTLQSTRTIPNKGSNDIFFAKYTTDGTLQWFDVAGSAGDDRVTRLSTNGETILIAGQFGGIMTINNKTLTPAGTLDANGIGKTDALGIVHDKNDNLLYAISAGGDKDDVAQSCVIDNEGNYIFTGNFYSSSMVFDDTHSLTNATPTTRDVFIAKYKGRSISFVSSNVKCAGTATGSITANPEGAWKVTKTYSWSKDGDPGFTANTQTISNVAAGTYNCTISDGTNSETASITLTDPTPISVSLKTKTDATCYGSTDGYLEAEVDDGVGTIDYLWTGTGTGVVATNPIQNTISAGTYSLTVTDDNGCTATVNNMVVSQPSKIHFKNTIVTPITASPGEINLAVQNGIPALSYEWTGPSGPLPDITEDIDDLNVVGNYSVIVTDSKGCIGDTSVLLVDSNSLYAFISQKQDVSCNGGTDGSLTAEAVNTTTSLTYSWTGPDGFTANTPSINNITAGSYSVTVTDTEPTPQTYTILGIIVTEPTSILAVTTTKGNPLCSGLATGYVDANVTGGTIPYSYSWEKDASPLSDITEVITNLHEGVYTVTVTDANNCTASNSATLANPNAITVADEIINVTCIGTKNDGIINLAVSGGTEPYKFRWSNGLTNDTINLLSAGTYNCTVTDANNCSLTSQYIVGQPDPLTALFTITNISCNGGANGTINLTASGGHDEPYEYLWNDGTISKDRTGLSSGTYSVKITDSKNCEKSFNTTLSQPNVLTISEVGASHVNVACKGSGTGVFEVSATGGSGLYDYSINSSTWQSSGVFSNLIAGDYTVTVRDRNAISCTSTLNPAINISEPVSAIAITSIESDDILCRGLSTGTISVQAEGGTGALAYKLLLNDNPTGNTTGATSGNFTGLAAGNNYKVEVTDANNCGPITSSVISISQPSSAIAFTSETRTNVTCKGLTNGSLSVQASGGTGALTYKLLLNDIQTGNTSGASSGNFTGLAAGNNYKVEVTDENNCGPFTLSAIAISEPQNITINNVSSSDVLCRGLASGTISVQAVGGTGSLAYKLLLNDTPSGNTTGASSGTFTDLAAGTNYKVEVTDANNCGPVASSVVIITEPASAIVIITVSKTDVSCTGLTTGAINISATGGTGTLAYSLLLNDAPTGNSSGAASGNFTGLAAGINYKVEVTDANNCGPVTSSIVSVSEPLTSIAINSVTSSDITCSGLSNGAVNVQALGGTGVLTYQLIDNGSLSGNITGATSGNFTGLAPGVQYKVEVIDANNCGPISTSVFAISEPDAIGIVNENTTDITCSGLTNGIVSVLGTGGIGALAYKLLLNDVPTANITGATSGNFTGLAAGSAYTVEITDANNCVPVKSGTLSITEPTPLAIISATATDINCFGNHNGAIRMQATGGREPFTYRLLQNNTLTGNTTGAASGIFTDLVAGTGYTVEIVDANNCGPLTSVSLTVLEPTSIAITSENTTKTTGPGLSDGTLQVAATGGTGTLTYALASGTPQQTGSFSGLAKGTYLVTVTDANNCGPVSSNSLIIDDPTSVDLIKSGIIRLYPNPVSEKVYIEVNNAELKELKVELKNIAGKAALTQRFENVAAGFTATIDLYQLPKGVYVIVVNNVVLKDKLIIQ